MTARSQDAQSSRREQQGVYVYGILPGDIEVEQGATGVGDPPGQVRVVRHGDLAALVSDVDLDKPLGLPADLVAHEELLDSAAADMPVLPLRFGAVVTGDGAVEQELLATHHDEFVSALRQLEGHVEYVVRGRYVESAILREAVAGDPRAAQLCEQIKDADPDASREQRMELGEIINESVEAKREDDTRALGDALAGHVAASLVRPPSHELDAAYVACLVATDAADDLEQRVRQLASDWQDRIELRLLGPMAAYDFVGAAAPAADSAVAEA